MKAFVFIILALFTGITVKSQTPGSLSVTVTTKASGQPRNYAPRNCIVVWVEDQNGNFIKTLLVNAQARRRNLSNWASATKASGSIFNSVDAITGATNNSHGTRTCTWDGTDSKGKLVADGNYTIHMELSDTEQPGLLSAYTFTKGPDPVNHMPADQRSFTSVSIRWVPQQLTSKK